MAKIPLRQRTELPPSRVGAVKPSFNLADQSGQKQLGQAIASIGGSIFDKITKAQATNEEAEAKGQIQTVLGQFDEFVAGNPNASQEEIRTEWSKHKASIAKIPTGLKTNIAKTNIANHLALTMGAYEQQAFTRAAATGAKQQLERANITLDTLKAQGKIQESADFVKEQEKNEIYPKGTHDLYVASEVPKMQRAEQLVKEKNTAEFITEGFQGITDNGGTKQDSYDFIEQQKDKGLITAKEKQKFTASASDYHSRQKQQENKTNFDKRVTSYQSLANTFLSGEVLQDDIERSGIAAGASGSSKDDIINKFNGYVAKSRTPQKQGFQSTVAGQNVMKDTVLKSNSGELGKIESYDALFKARYGDDALSDEDFMWSMDKIDNPYPQEIISNVEEVTDNLGRGVTWFSGEKYENNIKDANKEFFSWLDKKIKVDDIPNKLEMQQTMNNLLANIPIDEPEIASSGRVEVVSPDGLLRTVPKEQLQEAIKQGWREN